MEKKTKTLNVSYETHRYIKYLSLILGKTMQEIIDNIISDVIAKDSAYTKA